MMVLLVVVDLPRHPYMFDLMLKSTIEQMITF
jgi:hypothetical protein